VINEGMVSPGTIGRVVPDANNRHLGSECHSNLHKSTPKHIAGISENNNHISILYLFHIHLPEDASVNRRLGHALSDHDGPRANNAVAVLSAKHLVPLQPPFRVVNL
jgi:hypothetical protein